MYDTKLFSFVCSNIIVSITATTNVILITTAAINKKDACRHILHLIMLIVIIVITVL